jgi:hypothetical protein
MASSLNLLVLRLAQFHSQSGTAGISSLLSRNEEELIAEAIAHHRASIHIQQLNRIHTNSNDVNAQQKAAQAYSLLRRYSSYSTLSSSSSSSNSNERNCCSKISSQKRKRRYWHLRRSPQNIKHLLCFDHLLEHRRLTLLRKSQIPSFDHQHHLTNHLSGINSSKQQRISI